MKPVQGDKFYNAYKRLDSQTDSQLMRSIRSLENRLAEHKKKIVNPSAFISEWDIRSQYYKIGIVEKWKKEIFNFEGEIAVGRLIAEERGLL